MKTNILAIATAFAVFLSGLQAAAQSQPPQLVENLYQLQNNVTPTDSSLARIVLGRDTRLDWGAPRLYLWQSNSTATVDGTNVVATRTGRGRWLGFHLASTSLPGLMPKLSGNANDVLDGTGQFRADAGGGSGGTSDHGALTGLTDDDHPQYHNDARGDARYSRRSLNLSDLSDASAARGNLGLGNSSTLAIGTTAGTVAAGDDSRILSSPEKTDLTDGGDSLLHFHASDRDRATHTGTQVKATISDFAHQGTHGAGGADPLPWSTIHGYGNTASRPSAATSNNAYLYFDTTTQKLYRSNGSTWDEWTPLPTLSAATVLGRGLGGTGPAEQLTLGSGFELAGTVLNVVGGSGGGSGLGYLQRSSAIVTNIHTAGEATHYAWTIPAGTLAVDGDAIVIDVPGALVPSGGVNGYAWRFMWDDAATELAEYGTPSSYFPLSADVSALDWRITIHRVTSNTLTVVARHSAGDIANLPTGATTNKVEATLVNPGISLTGYSWDDDPLSFSLTTTIKQSGNAATLRTFGYIVSKAGTGGASDHGTLTGLSDDDHAQYHNDARGDARYAKRDNNLSDLASSATARSNLGLGNAAVASVGTGSGSVAAGDDNRFLSSGQKTDLTDGGDSDSHYHASDRDRAAHAGTQTKSTISDFAHASTHIPGGSDAIAGLVTTNANNTLTGTNRLTKVLYADGGIVAPTMTITNLAVDTLTLGNSIDGAKVGTGIAAGNITSGTLDNSRLDADIQDLADGTLGESRIDAAIARLAGPTFTGDPKAPTPPADDNSPSIATTAFVQGEIAGLGAVDLSGTGTSTNATSFALLTLPVISGNSTVADLLVSGSGPTNSFTARLIASAFNRNPGSPAIRTNAPVLHDATGSSDAWITLSDTSIVLNARGPAGEKFNWSYKGTSISQAHGITNAGGAFGLSATDLLAAYDFTNNLDSATFGPFPMSETNSPTYSGGILLSRASNTSFVQQASVVSHFMTNSANPFSVAFRVRADAGIASGSYGLWSHTGRFMYRWYSPSNTVRIAQISTIGYTVPPVTNQFMVHVLVYDGTTNRNVWVNGTNFISQGAYETSTSPLLVGTDSTTGAYARNFSWDWLYIWRRALSSNEIVKLNTLTNDNGLTFPQLDP